MWGHDYMGGGMGLAMILFWLIPVGLLAWCISKRTGSSGSGDTASSHRTAREILNSRYAAGELDREEYLRRREDLDGAKGP